MVGPVCVTELLQCSAVLQLEATLNFGTHLVQSSLAIASPRAHEVSISLGRPVEAEVFSFQMIFNTSIAGQEVEDSQHGLYNVQETTFRGTAGPEIVYGAWQIQSLTWVCCSRPSWWLAVFNSQFQGCFHEFQYCSQSIGFYQRKCAIHQTARC